MPLMRSLAPFMVIIAILSFMVGCSGPAGSHRSGYAESAGRRLDSDESASTERWTTLRIELFERNDITTQAHSITDNYFTQYIQQKFGDPEGIKVEFITIPRAEEVGRLQVLMAANQAPDIVFTYDLPTVYSLYRQGKLTDLSPLLDQYGQELKGVLGEEILSYGRINGTQFAIPAKRVLRARGTTVIREDWLKEVGMPLPETTEQFYEALKAFKRLKLEKYGENIYPYGHIDYYHIAPLQYSFWEWDHITEEDLYADPGWVMPGNKEAFRFLNQLYYEGLIDPDFHLDRFAQQFKKDLVNGRVGAATPNTLEPVYMGYLAELQKNNPNALLTPIDPFTNADGKRLKPILESTGMYIMVPKTSRNAEAAIKYLNWMAKPENYTALQNTVEGVKNYFDYCIILNGKYVSSTDEQLNLKANASDPQFEVFALQSVKYGMNDGIAIPQIPTILQSEIKYSAVLSDRNDEMFVKVITANPEEFDAVYDQEVAEYMSMGGRQVQEEKHRAYQAYHQAH